MGMDHYYYYTSLCLLLPSQQGRSHVFEMPDGSLGYGGSSHTLSSGSPSGPSYGLGMPLYMQDGSMSSSQSISSSNSEKQSEDIEDNIEPLDRYRYATVLCACVIGIEAQVMGIN